MVKFFCHIVIFFTDYLFGGLHPTNMQVFLLCKNILDITVYKLFTL